MDTVRDADSLFGFSGLFAATIDGAWLAAKARNELNDRESESADQDSGVMTSFAPEDGPQVTRTVTVSETTITSTTLFHLATGATVTVSVIPGTGHGAWVESAGSGSFYSPIIALCILGMLGLSLLLMHYSLQHWSPATHNSYPQHFGALRGGLNYTPESRSADTSTQDSGSAFDEIVAATRRCLQQGRGDLRWVDTDADDLAVAVLATLEGLMEVTMRRSSQANNPGTVQERRKRSPDTGESVVAPAEIQKPMDANTNDSFHASSAIARPSSSGSSGTKGEQITAGPAAKTVADQADDKHSKIEQESRRQAPVSADAGGEDRRVSEAGLMERMADCMVSLPQIGVEQTQNASTVLQEASELEDA